jgi:hypothetical protein
MVFFDKCHFIDGYCRYYHGVAYQDADQEVSHELSQDIAQNIMSAKDIKTIYSFDTTFVRHGCEALGFLPAEYPCAACDLGCLERAGVRFGKLGGRGLPLETRLKALDFIYRSQQFPDQIDLPAEYQQIFDSSCNCYYKTDTQSCSAIETRDYISDHDHTAINIPPLSQAGILGFEDLLTKIANKGHAKTKIYLNDLGTYLLASKLLKNSELSNHFSIGFGALLARIDDDPRLQKAVDSFANPTRLVKVFDGQQESIAELRYKPPTPELQKHWSTASITEPSSQRALRFLLES